MEGDIVRGPPHSELVTSGRELPDQVGRAAVVRVPAGLRAQYGDGVAGRLLPVAKEGPRSRVEEREARELGATVTAYGTGYDAGTELNTEDFADIVPPCQALMGVSSGDAGSGTSNPALAENGVIHHHRGIQGGDDLDPDVHGWTDPVVMVTAVRVG